MEIKRSTVVPGGLPCMYGQNAILLPYDFFRAGYAWFFLFVKEGVEF